MRQPLNKSLTNLTTCTGHQHELFGHTVSSGATTYCANFQAIILIDILHQVQSSPEINACSGKLIFNIILQHLAKFPLRRLSSFPHETFTPINISHHDMPAGGLSAS